MAKLSPEEQQAREIGALFSYHVDPAARRDPRYQMNNPMNALGSQPEMVIRSNPYNDGAIPMQTPGMIPAPMPQQRIILNRPNAHGLPALMMDPMQARALQEAPNPAMLPMSGSMQVEQMGIDTSPGRAQQRRG
jgi:hypothetical protein